MVMPGPGPISVELKDDFDMMTSVTLEQPIYTFGKIHNAIRAATIAMRSADSARRPSSGKFRMKLQRPI